MALRELHGDFEHVLTKQRHPCGRVGLFEIAASRQRRAAVEDANVVEAQEAAFEKVLAEPVLAVCPPGEIQRELGEDACQELQIRFAAERCSVRCKKIAAQACTGGLTSPKFHS